MTCAGHFGPPLNPLERWHRENVDIVKAGGVDAESSSAVEINIAFHKSAISGDHTSGITAYYED